MRPARWIAIAVLLGSVLVLFLHLGTTGEEFSRYNIGWNGTSAFFSTLDRHTTKEITDPRQLKDYTNATLLVIAPDREITTEEGVLYRDFVARGNTLFLADDFGTGNTLLDAIGSSITIRQYNLSSLDHAYNDPYMAFVYPEENAWPLPKGMPLLLNRAVTLKGGEPLLATTIFSWEETMPDRELSGNESLGRFTVMARETTGNGTVIVLSDPSVFINGMEDPGYANRIFRTTVAGSGLIIIDGYSTRVLQQDTTGEVIHTVRSNTAYTFAAAALLMAGILIAWQRRIL